MEFLKSSKKSFAWTRVPFTFGHVTEMTESPHSLHPEQPSKANQATVKDVTYNGMIASLQILVLLIAVAFAQTVSSYAADFKYTGLDTLTLIVYMLVGLVIMICFMVGKDSIADSTGSASPGRDSVGLIGLVGFFVLGSVLDMFQLTAALECALVWSGCARLHSAFAINVAFHAIRIVFVGTETIFCIVFNRRIFRDRIGTRYGLMLLQAANVSLWFEALLRESVRLFDSPSQGPRGSVDADCVGNVTNVTEHVIRCFHQNTTLYDVIENVIDPTFLPFTIEFMLLAWEGIGHYFFHCAVGVTPGRTPTPRELTDCTLNQGPVEDRSTNEVDYSDQDLENSELKYQDLNDQGFNHRDSLNGPDTPSTREEADNGETEHEFLRQRDNLGLSSSRRSPHPVPTDESSIRSSTTPENISEESPLLCNRETTPVSLQRGRMNWCTHAWTILVFVNGLVLCVFTFLCQYLTPEVVVPVKSFALYFLLLNWILMTIAAWIGFAFSGNFQVERRKPFSSMYYLLLVSSFGPTAYNVFTCIAILSQDDSQTEPGFSFPLHVFLEILNTIHIYFQLSFSFYAERVRPDQKDRSSRPTIFKAVVLYLSVTNGFLWLTGTFGGYEFSGTRGKRGQVLQMEYFGAGAWGILYNFVVPLLLFFRFNSCILFTKTYLALRKADKTCAHSTSYDESAESRH